MATVNGESTISVYSGELKPETIVANMARIKVSFPQLTPEFYKMFIDRVKDKGFSDERLDDAVNHVIDNCKYPVPTLADFIGFDQRVKVLSYEDLCNLVCKHEAVWANYTTVIIADKVFYVKKSDKEIYNIPEEI